MHPRAQCRRLRLAGPIALTWLGLLPVHALAQAPTADAVDAAAPLADSAAPAETTAASQPAPTTAPDEAAAPADAAAPEPPAEPTPAIEATPTAPTVVEREVSIELRATRAAPALDEVQLATVVLLGGAVAAVVAVPAALVTGSVLGTLPQNLILAALPPLLVAGLVPPLVVAGSEWLLQDWLVDDPGNFWIAWGSTTLVHVAALVTGGLLGVTTTDLPSLATLVAAEGLLLPLTATTALSLTRAEDSHAD